MCGLYSNQSTMSFRKDGFKLRIPGLSFRRAVFRCEKWRGEISLFIFGYLRTVFILALLLSFHVLISQNFHYKNWTVTEGLSSNEVHAILLKSNGELLLGTDNGVQLFDGVKFRSIPAKNEKFSSITAFSISKMADGQIWVKSYRNGLFRIVNDTLIPYEYNSIILRESQSFVGQYFVDNEGGVHYTYYMPGFPNVYSINKSGQLKRDKLRAFQEAENATKFGYKLNGDIVLMLSAPEQKKTGNKTQFNKDTFVKFQSDIPYFDESFFRRNTFHTHDNLTYVAFNNSIIQFSKDGKPLRRYNLTDRVIKLVSYKHEIYALTFSGVYLLHPSTGQFKRLFLNNLTITDLVGDNEGGLWFSTTESGLFYLASRDIHVPEANSTLAGERLHKVAADDNLLLTLDLESVLRLYEFEDQEYKLLSSFSDFDYQISHYLKLKGSEFFLNFTRGEIEKGELTIKEIDRYPRIGNDILEWEDNSFLIASNNRGVMGLNSNGAAFYFNKQDTISFPAYALEKYRDTVYVGLKEGVFRFSNGKYRRLYDGIITSPVVTMRVWNNNLVVGTKGQGLFVITSAGVSRISQFQGSNSNNIQSLAVSDNGKLWVASAAGLSIVNSNLEVFSLNEDDGLPSSVVKDLSYANGRVNVLTESGFCYIDTSISKPIENYDLSLYLPIENELIENGEFRVLPLGKREVFLNVHENSLRYNSGFHFQVLYKSDTLRAPNGNIALAGLEPGTHELSVLVGLKGHFPAKEAVFTLVVPSYYYEENWFKALVVLLGLGLIVYAIVFLQKQAEFKRITKMKTSMAQYEALNLQINPHFLFNSLNNIKVLSSNDPNSRIHQLVGKLSKLTRNVLENSKLTTVSLREELDNIQRFVDIENIRFQERPINFEMIIDPKLNLEQHTVPPMILQPTVENAIWHGLLPKARGERNLQMVVKEITSGFMVQIGDNGIGWQNKQPSEDLEVNKTSIGLKNTIERLKMYEDMNLGRASLKLEERQGSDDQYCGMLVSFVFYPKFK